jgi:hypothetical protein
MLLDVNEVILKFGLFNFVFRILGQRKGAKLQRLQFAS